MLIIINRASDKRFLVDTIVNRIFALNTDEAYFVKNQPNLLHDKSAPVSITVPDLATIKKFRKALSSGNFTGFTGPQVLAAFEEHHPELFI